MLLKDITDVFFFFFAGLIRNLDKWPRNIESKKKRKYVKKIVETTTTKEKTTLKIYEIE